MPVSTLDSSPFASHSAVDPLASSLFAPPPPSSSRGPLHPGAVWEGLQRSGRNSYKVRVNIDTVDLHQGTVSGLLQIQHLTPELESLVTFFEGEIIGDKAGFRTARWGATEADDMKHWSRFPAFSKSLRSSLLKPNLNFKHLNKPYLFMRWKEQFVVPSSHAQNIHGASFAGFYYLCLDFDSGPDDLPSPSAFPSRANDRERECTLSPPASRLGAPSRSLSTGSSGGRSRPPLRSPPIPSGGIGLGVGGSINEEREQSSSSEGLAIPMGTGSRSRSHSTNAVPTATSGSSTSTSPPVAPPRPRRASSASGFSYAAVVRGAGSPVSPPITPLPPPDSLGATADSTTPQRLPGFAPSHLLHPPPSPSSISHTPEASTPKEGAQDPTQGFDFNFSSLSLSLGLGAGASGEEQASPSSSTSTSHLPSSSSTLTDPSIPNIPIPSPSLPTPSAPQSTSSPSLPRLLLRPP
ncbi:vacuolar import and degradation protein-domain-containing protein [Leucosporidium creatinivorum]|uniref:Vacuolar import and degradation protein-domain-containing protein n=1 Tax=Leucosporidium creatinivorum TaxID=106004 RepID=A0A1Y2F3J5_9BASI|nr:vacuolar import and degradation protein-domain-containing protein [Leucosporidium creatinivorum]